jgi:hypothetical protein
MKKQLLSRVILAGLAIVVLTPAFADDSDNIVCDAKTYDYQGIQVLLNLDKKKADQQLYFLQNMADKPLVVDHIPSKASASAGWSTTLDPQHWTVLSLNRKEMTFQCSMEKEGDISMKKVLCENVLKVCRAVNPVFKEGTAGSYWVSENQTSLDSAIAQTKQRGIQLMEALFAEDENKTSNDDGSEQQRRPRYTRRGGEPQQYRGNNYYQPYQQYPQYDQYPRYRQYQYQGQEEQGHSED